MNPLADLSDKQKAACELIKNKSKIDILGYGGAKGGGKSHLARVWLWARAVNYPGSTGLLVRKTYQELYRNHTKRFITDFPDLHYVERKNHFELPNGSLIELAYCEGERDLERFQGAEYDTVVVDQAEQHVKSVFHYLRSCMRTTNPKVVPKMMLTFNPGGVGHSWLKKMFVDGVLESDDPKKETVAFLPAKVYDNKWIMDNDPAYIQRLEALPPQMREAYLNGSFDTFEGQFFTIRAESAEAPFEIPESECMEGMLYGSLDHGITHPTSFGLWYLDKENNMHRLFTYLNNGNTAYEHAKEIKDRIEAFQWTHGHMPREIYADPSMWTKQRINPHTIVSYIDEYKKVFGDRVRFLEANNNKVHGCMLMRQVLAGTHGFPSMFYWPQYNTMWVEGIKAVVTDDHNKEVYLKMDGDDCADEGRYGIVAMHAVIKNRAAQQLNKGKILKYQAQMKEKSWQEI